jgi:hypothetical protein
LKRSKLNVSKDEFIHLYELGFQHFVDGDENYEENAFVINKAIGKDNYLEFFANMRVDIEYMSQDDINRLYECIKDWRRVHEVNDYCKLHNLVLYDEDQYKEKSENCSKYEKFSYFTRTPKVINYKINFHMKELALIYGKYYLGWTGDTPSSKFQTNKFIKAKLANW